MFFKRSRKTYGHCSHERITVVEEIDLAQADSCDDEEK